MYKVSNTIYTSHLITSWNWSTFCYTTFYAISPYDRNTHQRVLGDRETIWVDLEVWTTQRFPGRLTIPQQTTLYTILGSGMYLQSILRNAWKPGWPLGNPRQWYADDCQNHVCWVIHHNCLQSPPHGMSNFIFCTTVLCLIWHQHLFISYQTMSCSTTSCKLHWQHCTIP